MCLMLLTALLRCSGLTLYLCPLHRFPLLGASLTGLITPPRTPAPGSVTSHREELSMSGVCTKASRAGGPVRYVGTVAQDDRKHRSRVAVGADDTANARR